MNLPIHIPLTFILCTLFSFIFFISIIKRTENYSKHANWIGGLILVWLIVQGYVAWTGFYANNVDAFPPPFILVIAPLVIVFSWTLLSGRGKRFIDELSLEQMTWLSIVRIPVEIVLFWLAGEKAIPELMTFAGRNFDIIGGITAPFVAYFGIRKKMLGKTGLLIWNFVMMGFLFFIVINAILSAPMDIQMFAFDQPNLAIAYFPYIWLPAYVASIVMFCHLASISKLLRSK